MFVKRRGVARVFKEMPWLWAITSRYSEELVVDVSTLNTGALGQFLEFNGDQWWLRIQSGGDEHVVALEGTPESPLGGRILAALNALHSNYAWGIDERVVVTHLVGRVAWQLGGWQRGLLGEVGEEGDGVGR